MFTWNDYREIKQYRKNMECTDEEKTIVYNIKKVIKIANRDNISRTQSYQDYYERNSEVRWAFLASMVSRNAGWNMTDLKGRYYATILPQTVKKHLFLTYEQANWIIFLDAFPQLLIYEESKRRQIPLFYLLQYFNVSIFMEKEWIYFWEKKDINRLMTALIINEQNKIQKPIIENAYFKKHVFHTALFKLQEMLHVSAVIFPTIEGNMYGFSVYQFETVQKRIELGKKLAELLFHPNYKSLFHRFALQTIHTGSRADYECYVREARKSCTPALREVYPVVAHKEIGMRDWFCRDTKINQLFLPEEYKGEVDITEWYKRKREQIYAASIVNRFVKRMDEFVI